MKNLHFANGDALPALGLGTWKSAPGEVGPAIKEAIRLGYRHFDCAAVYGNEAEIGTAFKEVFADGNVQRSELWITSKLWNNSHAPNDVMPAAQKTLADLQLDYLDLYLMHWPVAFKSDIQYAETAADTVALAVCPISDTWAAMEKVLETGQARHLGVANFSIAKLQTLVETTSIQPEMNQIELHPYLQQPKMLSFCREQGIHLTGYAPLGSGGRPEHLKSDDEPVLLGDPVIERIAKQHDATTAQILIAWGLQRGTAVIPKSVHSQRLAENFAATQISLNADEMAAINQLDQHRRYFNGEMWVYEGTDYTLANLWNGD